MDGIPSEIVAEIFILCLPTTNYLRPHPSTAPILLTHVCSSWRAFAFDLPDLWANIHLSDEKWEVNPLPFQERNQMLLHQAELWNRHSRGRIASISLDLTYLYSYPDEEFSHDAENFTFWHPLVHRVVMENLQTVRHLFIQFNFGDHGLPFYRLPSSEIRNLESLHFVITNGRYIAQVPTIFSHAPSLRRVIVDVPCGRMDSTTQLPWAQLTHLILVPEMSLQLFYFIVQNCLSLEMLSLNINHSIHVPVPVLKEPITMNTLRDLTFTLCNIQDPSFINTITFPVLEKFRCFSSTKYSPPDFCWEPLTSSHWHMLHQLLNLHTLVLGFQTISGDMLLEILRLTPHLVELSVDSDLGTYRSFLQGLTYQSNLKDSKEGHHNILEHLETFTLYMEISGDGRLQPRIPDDLAVILDALLVMVLSRSCSASESQSLATGTDSEENNATFSNESKNAPPAPLRKVTLHLEDTKHSQQTADLEEFRARCRTYPHLSPPNMVFDVICDFSEYHWLELKVDTWETLTYRS